jgi:hypothetical protein
VSQRVHRAKRVAAKILDHFHNPRPAKAGQRFRVTVLSAALRDVQGITHMVLDGLGKRAQILAARSPASKAVHPSFIP